MRREQTRWKVWSGVLVLLILFLVVAWYDGGREPRGLIVEPIDLTLDPPEGAR